MAYFGEAVSPSMNPSRVQLRRYAIHGYARHTHPKVLSKYIYGYHPRGLIKAQAKSTCTKPLLRLLLLLRLKPLQTLTQCHHLADNNQTRTLHRLHTQLRN